MKSARKISQPARINKDVRRILIVKPSSLGDIFHVFPAVARLHELFPQAKFDWLVNPTFADAVDYAPVPVDRKIIFRRRELGQLSTMLPSAVELIRELRQESYDYVFDFQGLFRSAFFARIARGRVVGFARPREPIARWFYHHSCKVNLRLHAVRRNQLLVERFFGTGTMRTSVQLPDNPANAEQLNIKLERLGLNINSKIVGVSPGARWESKTFPCRLFADVISQTAQKHPDTSFVIMGAPADQKLADTICQMVGLPQVVSLAGSTTLGELVELINRCKAMLANDSGPVHIAAAAGVPVVCFYGPTNPNMTGPFGDNHTIFQRTDLPCIKCMRRHCSLVTTECHAIDADAAASALSQKITKE